MNTVQQHRNTIRNILDRTDPRKLLIIGPCSVDFEAPIIEYAQFLHTIAQEVQDKIYIVMRFYIHKPRTTVGWK